MRFTFGIVTTGNPRVPTIIKSINDNVPNPEIIVVGGEPNGVLSTSHSTRICDPHGLLLKKA